MFMTSRITLVAFLALPVLVFSGSSNPTAPIAAQASPKAALLDITEFLAESVNITLKNDGGCGICHGPCLSGGMYGHMFDAGMGPNAAGSGTHCCESGHCADYSSDEIGVHPTVCSCECEAKGWPEGYLDECDDGSHHFAATWSEIRSLGSIDPVALADAHPYYEFNRSRNAIQVIGCGDQVIAHIPLATATQQ
jgi:hypothetical protein